MLLIGTVEINGQMYLMSEIPEDKKESLMEAIIKYDPRYKDMQLLTADQLDHVKHLLSEQAARALGYKKVAPHE